jgi:hypothetical protein
VALTNGQTRETLANDMWQACKILRRDNNFGGVKEYIGWTLLSGSRCTIRFGVFWVQSQFKGIFTLSAAPAGDPFPVVVPVWVLRI